MRPGGVAVGAAVFFMVIGCSPIDFCLLVTFIIFWIQDSDESEQLPVPAACLPCVLGMAFVPSQAQGLTLVTAKVVWFGLWLQHGKVSGILAFCHLRSHLPVRGTCNSVIRNRWVDAAGDS